MTKQKKLLRKGVYYRRPSKHIPNGQIVILRKVQNYEDEKVHFAICDWEYEYGYFEKTLIRQKSFKSLIRLGDL
jgi:hypothetical protein